MLGTILLLACAGKPHVDSSAEAIDSTPPPAPTVLAVSGYHSDRVHLFDPETGASLGELGPISGPQSIRPSPGGGWLIVAEKTAEVLHLDPSTGDLSVRVEAGAGGLLNPTAAIAGPDGGLLVADYGGDAVLRFDAAGEPLGVFWDGQGVVDGPDAGMLVGPDGLIWLPAFDSDNVVRLDAGGALVDVVAAGSGLVGPSRPRTLQLHEGEVLVSSWGSSELLRYDPDQGYQGVLLEAPQPTGFVLDEARGVWLVTTDQTNRVLRFDAESGQRMGDLIEPGAGGLDGATFLAWIEAPWLVD